MPLTPSLAAELLAFLIRVQPRGQQDADRLERLIVTLQRIATGDEG